MSFDGVKIFTKEDLDIYLKELAKQYKKCSGREFPAEIILVGGAAVIANYGFREMTADIDAIIYASSAMKDAINIVGDKFNLPNGWINDNFIRTSSYTNKLVEYSKYYGEYSNILTIRTIGAEYLIAMKLKSGRQYKNDLSDIVGILVEHIKREEDITLDRIKKATVELYGSWQALPEESKKYIENIFCTEDIHKVYDEIRENERTAGEMLIQFEDYPGVTKESNVNEILEQLKKAQDIKK